MSAEDLAELSRLRAHLVTRNEEERGTRAIDAAIYARIRTDSGTELLVCLVQTEHPSQRSSSAPGEKPLHQRAVLVSVSPENRATAFHIRSTNLSEVIAPLAKILADIVVARRKRDKTSKNTKETDEPLDP